MSRYTDWTSGEPIEKEWPTDPALREAATTVLEAYDLTGWPDQEVMEALRAALAAAEAAPPLECVYCHVALVYRPDDPVMHIGCAIAISTFLKAYKSEYAALRSPDTEPAGEAR